MAKSGHQFSFGVTVLIDAASEVGRLRYPLESCAVREVDAPDFAILNALAFGLVEVEPVLFA